MRENDSCGVMLQGAFDHFARIHAGLAECAVEQLFKGDHAMLGIEKQHQKYFLLPSAEQ